MTKDEAINLIDSVLAQVSLPREGHVKLQQAIQLLRTLEETPKK